MAAAALGIQVTPLTPQIAQSVGVNPNTTGVVVVQANPASDAAGKGLQRGDVITTVNRIAVTSAADVAKQVAAAKAAGKTSVLLWVQRRALGRFVSVGIN